MVVGRQLDRWYYADGEETVPGGTNLATYASACAGCHGSASGDPGDAASVAPDALSSASITLSTHELRDRRRPLEPITVEPGGDRVDYATTIAPLVAGECTRCHEGADLTYEALTAHVDLVDLRARRSPLMERLVGVPLDAPGSPRDCPPAEPSVVRAFTRWIEAGAFEDLSRAEP